MPKDTITIDGRAYVAADSIPDSSADVEDGGCRIVILQRGFVAVGRYRRHGDQVVISSAAIIRRWGTSRGLGELAAEGPKANTVLDECPPIRCHQLAVLATIDCTHASWESRS